LSRRLFFAAQIEASWPEKLPPGRLLLPDQRHCTLAFLGNIPYEPLQALLPHLPLPAFPAPQGICDQLLLLPPHHPRVVAYHISWADDSLAAYQLQLSTFLRSHNYRLDDRPFLSHVTIARAPFKPDQWLASFRPLPCRAIAIHLYESLGNLQYHPLWSHRLAS
jgi:RNA 2',3'-cyclic 3'-phosphodiesterase